MTVLWLVNYFRRRRREQT